jgi:hypothetical protein
VRPHWLPDTRPGLGVLVLMRPRMLVRARATIVLTAILLSGCIRQQDLDEWSGQPVSKLDKHPFFLTVPHTTTTTPDGTEIRDYVNGGNVATCSYGGGSASCGETLRACHNMFYIKNGIIDRYSPIGSGGVHCVTNEMTRPDYMVTGAR